MATHLRGGHLDGSRVDVVDDVVWGTSIDGATDALSGSQDLLHGAGQLAGHAAGAHRPGNGQDIVVGNVAAVLDVLDLLAVPWGLLQGLDDQRGSRGHHSDGSHTVLDAQLDGDLQTLPVTSGLGNVVSDLLGRLRRHGIQRWRLDLGFVYAHPVDRTYQTQWTDLGGQGGSGTDLTADATHVHCKEEQGRRLESLLMQVVVVNRFSIIFSYFHLPNLTSLGSNLGGMLTAVFGLLLRSENR